MSNEGYLSSLSGAESSGNPYDQAKRSSAYGEFQFTKGTWNEFIARHPELGLKPEDRANPEAQRIAIPVFTAENQNYLSKHGIEPTNTNTYMAHFLGAGGARDFINAYKTDPNTHAVNVVHPQSVSANPEVFYHKDGSPRTVGEIYQIYGKKFGEGADSPSQKYQAPAPYNPAERQGWSAKIEPTDQAAPQGQTPFQASLPTNPMAASGSALSGGTSEKSSLEASGNPKDKTSLFTPYQWHDIPSYYVPQLPMKVGGRARAHKVPLLPKHLASDKHFSKVWEGLHTDPSSVSHEDLLKAYQKISGTDENPAPAVEAAQQAQETSGTQGFSSGGAVQETTPGPKSKTAVGYIRSDTGGTADKLSFNVVQDSYVIPADIVSGMGHGNSDAGAKIIAERFKGRLSARTKGTVPVKLSGGEYVIPPQVVKRVGKGSIERGIDHFEDLIKTVRAKTILDLHHKKKPIR